MISSKSPAPQPLPSDLRVAPRQARAQETVRHILDTAATLLDEVGVDGFNTNLLAERAEVRVRTVYRYFPNKTAVLVALGERILAELDGWAEAEFARIDGKRDWRPTLERATRGLFDTLRTVPGHAAIRRALRAVPELYLMDQQDNERVAELLARALRRIAPTLTSVHARRVARCSIESTVAIVDLALREPPGRARALLEEAVQMQRAYLETALA